MKSVKEVSKLSGVSRRTLQYYDEIGLLPPSAVKESGYRQYDDESLRRLWNILFYKELGLSLDNIRLLLESPKEMEKELMRQHKQVLLEKQAQLQKLLLSVDRMLNDEFDISMLRDFDKNRLEAVKIAYAKEIQTLMESGFFLPLAKSGIVLGNVPIIENASKIMSISLDKLITLGGEVVQKFRIAMNDGPESSAAEEAVATFREFINILIPCDGTALRNIGQVYLNDKKELDEKVPGLAEFVYKAILHVYQ